MRTSSRARLKVLIADDHTVVREGLAAIIEGQSDMLLVGQAKNGQEAADLWQQVRPDIGLFDLRMPMLDAVAAIQAIREHNNDARIIILTTYDGDEDIYRALRAGAKGYMLKDATLEQITLSVRSVAAGGSYVPPPVAVKLAERVGQQALSARELEVLRLAAAGKPNKAIAGALGLTPATVKFHLNNAYSKLGVSSRTAAIAAALKRGLIELP